jgi:hypothetical protein
MGLLLHHNRPRGYGLAVTNVSHLELYEIAGTEFAVDGEIEQGEFPARAVEVVSLDSMIGSCVDGANKSAPRPNGARRPTAVIRERPESGVEIWRAAEVLGVTVNQNAIPSPI